MRKCIVASGVLIEGGRVLLVRHPRLGVWIYPGGHVEQGETPSEAVVREFEEETGLLVEPVGRRAAIDTGDVVGEVMPVAILREVVRYPDEVHIHYDLVFRVRRVGGQLREGRWFPLDMLDAVETYENVREVVRVAAREAVG